MVLDTEAAEIVSPKPLFKEDSKPISGKRFERLELGTKWAGMIVDVTREGIEINGYYRCTTGEKVYSNLRDPAFIPWDELEKVKNGVSKPLSRKKKTKPKKEVETFQDFDLDAKYLETLPKVELNGNYYYVDTVKKERRSVKNPSQVVKY
jgi:hypothetical protein